MKKPMEARLESNLPLLKWLQIDVLFFAAAVFIAYQIHFVGLSLTQVLIGESIFALTMLLFEVPTGVFSDLVSRKTTLLISQGLLIIGVIMLATAQSFYQIIIIQIIWGISSSTLSGTDSAMLYDTLKALGREQTYKRVLGSFTAFSLVAVALGQVLSGVIAHFNMHLTVLLCAPLPIVKCVLILFLKEPEREPSKHKHKPVKHAYSSVGYIIGHKTILMLMVASMFLGLGWKTVIHTYNPYMEIINVPIIYWGIPLAIFNILAAFIAKNTHTIIDRLGEFASLAVIYGLFIIGYLLLATVHTTLGFIFLIFIWTANPLNKIFFSEELNKRTVSSMRATVLSVSSFCLQGLQMVALPAIGYISDIYSLRTMYLLMATIIILVGIGSLVGLRKSLRT